MIPASNIGGIEINEIKQPSKTYKINTTKSEVSIKGYTDGLEAVKQAVQLILSTERYMYPIYSWNYGVELESLIGKEYSYIVAEIKRRIREALMQDDRISSVDGFKFTRQDDELYVEFEVVSDVGSFSTGLEVNI